MHSVEFYTDARFPAAAIACRLADAIASGRGACAVATPAHLDQLRAALAPRVDVDGAIASGSLVLINAHHVYAIARDAESREAVVDALIGERIHELLRRRGSAVLFGEFVDVLCANGDHRGAIALEQWWNRQIAALPISMHCGYSVESFPDAETLEEFRRVCDEHAYIVHRAEYDDFGRVAAELDQVSAILETEVAHRLAFETAYAGSRVAEQQIRAHLVTLQRITSALSEAATFDDLAEVATVAIADALGASVAGLTIDGRLIALRGAPAPGDRDAFAFALDGTRASWAPAAELPGELALGQPAVCVRPLEAGGERLGTLLLGFPASEASVEQRALAEDLTHQLALAVERARGYELVARESDRAEAANAAKDRFLAMLGHELRNPLAPILTATQLMRLNAPDAFAWERSTIERSLSHMTRLVDDLLEVARIERGTVELARAPVEIAELVAGAIEVAISAIDDRGHRLHVAVPAGLAVDADRTRMTQVISKLLTNAARYTRRGGAIELSAAEHGDSVVLAVSDNGDGIAAELLPRVFDLFVQGSQGVQRESGGLGLGLAIARSIVELHGGTISAESDGPGKGSRFVVALPILRAKLVLPSIDDAGTAARRRILVVDDNRDAAWLLGRALQRLGHEVRIANDGVDALELVRAWTPQVAFLDIGLPRMDGYVLCGHLGQLPQRPRLVAVTGFGRTSDHLRSRAAGFDEHLVKPVSLHDVRAAIDKLG